MNNISIVVPVYKDWQSLEQCLSSLIFNINSRHKVLIINDLGPDSEIMEMNILKKIEGIKNFNYFKNNFNLGFVKTCNRAVYELDQTENDIFLLNSDTKVTAGFLEEMQEVMSGDEKCGVVCPRSNNATLLTIPLITNGKELSAEDSFCIYNHIKYLMEKKTIIPTGVGFAMLIKRCIIDKYGLFDEIYGRGYNEENDFCQRIKKRGYHIVMANRSFVFHIDSKSFGQEKNELHKKNHTILVKRYPFYQMEIDKYFRFDLNFVDYYAILIANINNDKKRILFDMRNIFALENNIEFVLNLFDQFYKEYGLKYNVFILAHERLISENNFCNKYINVYLEEKDLIGLFDLGIVMYPFCKTKNLFKINRRCLKYMNFFFYLNNAKKKQFGLEHKIFSKKNGKLPICIQNYNDMIECIHIGLNENLNIIQCNNRFKRLNRYRINSFYFMCFRYYVKNLLMQ